MYASIDEIIDRTGLRRQHKGDEAVLPSSLKEIKDWLKQPVEEKHG